jgi:uncharacterized glyoxalase superfamily protein PhnB
VKLEHRRFPMSLTNSVPVISTADVLSTVELYEEVLGFNKHFVYGDPPVYAGIERDGVLLYVTHDAEMASALKQHDLHPDIFIWVKGIDKLFEEHSQRGAKIVETISDRPWDARQYVLEDPNGYRLKVAEPIDES